MDFFAFVTRDFEAFDGGLGAAGGSALRAWCFPALLRLGRGLSAIWSQPESLIGATTRWFTLNSRVGCEFGEILVGHAY